MKQRQQKPKVKTITFQADSILKATRLDRIIAQTVEEIGRKAAQSLINAKKVRVNGRVVWLCSWKVNPNDTIEITQLKPDDEKPAPFTSFEDAWVVSEEADLIAVNKPAGLLVHKTRAESKFTLFDLATKRFGPLVLFHRLDRDTSGIVLLTRHQSVNRYLDTAFKEHTIIKEYIALVEGGDALEAMGDIRFRIANDPKKKERMVAVEKGGKRAVTHYEKVGEAAQGLTLLRLFPETGRTHQLRVHLAAMGAPIAGDSLYGKDAKRFERLFLHARRLTLPALDGFPEREYVASPDAAFQSAMGRSDAKRG